MKKNTNHSTRKPHLITLVILFILLSSLLCGYSFPGKIFAKRPWRTATSNQERRDLASKKDSVIKENLEVHFINVGEADATLVKCGDSSMLIDAGDNGSGTAIQKYLYEHGVKSLDYLVLTHPDADHIGGADVIISKFNIKNIFMADYKKDNRTYSDVVNAINYRWMKWSTPSVGSSYSLGNASFKVVGPLNRSDEPNNVSICLILSYGNNRFLFTGDAEKTVELDLINSGADLSCDVYKAGHHGSYTSSSKELLDAAKPKYAVISCGSENKYGHPHDITLRQFKDKGIKVFRTDESGDIVATSDGLIITWDKAPSTTWKPGIRQDDTISGGQVSSEEESDVTYILNLNTKKFHKPDCPSAPTNGSGNRMSITYDRAQVIEEGYSPCGRCKP